jgi:hypothetical protein
MPKKQETLVVEGLTFTQDKQVLRRWWYRGGGLRIMLESSPYLDLSHWYCRIESSKGLSVHSSGNGTKPATALREAKRGLEKHQRDAMRALQKQTKLHHHIGELLKVFSPKCQGRGGAR